MPGVRWREDDGKGTVVTETEGATPSLEETVRVLVSFRNVPEDFAREFAAKLVDRDNFGLEALKRWAQVLTRACPENAKGLVKECCDNLEIDDEPEWNERLRAMALASKI